MRTIGWLRGARADRDRYAALRQREQTRVRETLLSELDRIEDTRGSLLGQLEGSVGLLQSARAMGTAAHLRAASLLAKAIAEFDALSDAPGVSSVDLDTETSCLLVTLSTVPPRGVRLPLICHQGQQALAATQPRASAIGTARETAAAILASNGDLVAAAMVLAGSPPLSRTERPVTFVAPEARSAYIQNRAAALADAASGAPQLAAAEQALSAAAKGLESLHRRASSALLALEAVEEQLGRTRDDYLDEYDMLSELPGVRSINVRSGVIAVRTDSLLIEHSGKTYDLGRYAIDIHLRSGVKIRNLDRRVSASMGTCDHPHVLNTAPCWGNSGRFFADRLAQHDYSAIIHQALGFLRQYNPSSTYARIDRWPERRAAPESP